MLGLMACGAIDPRRLDAVDVHRAHGGYFVGPHTRYLLKFDHCPHLRRHVQQDGVYAVFGNGTNRPSFPCVASAGAKRRDRLKPMQHTWGDKLVLDSPFEYAPDAVDAEVDDAARKL